MLHKAFENELVGYKRDKFRICRALAAYVNPNSEYGIYCLYPAPVPRDLYRVTDCTLYLACRIENFLPMLG